MTPLHKQLAERIQRHGPITVADYMQSCLLDPEHGYYTKRQPLGQKGDFTTAPEISQIFGELLAAWVITCWQQQGGGPATLLELGPGRGTLMADMLRVFANLGVLPHWNIQLFEASPTLKSVQEKTLASYDRVTWIDSLDEHTTTAPLYVVANEFFDALPIHQYVGDQERSVTCRENGELTFTPAGAVTREDNPQAHRIVSQLANLWKTQSGCGLFVDYGYATAQHQDTLQAVRHHQRTGVLDTPGEADLSAHVDFFALARAALKAGCTPYGPIEQGTFLNLLGAQERTEALAAGLDEAKSRELVAATHRLTSFDEMGKHFKVMAVTSPNAPAPEGFTHERPEPTDR